MQGKIYNLHDNNKSIDAMQYARRKYRGYFEECKSKEAAAAKDSRKKSLKCEKEAIRKKA